MTPEELRLLAKDWAENGVAHQEVRSLARAVLAALDEHTTAYIHLGEDHVVHRAAHAMVLAMAEAAGGTTEKERP